MNKRLNKYLATMLLVLFAVALGGCNTVHGFGQDIEKLGDKMQESSKK